MFMVVIIVTPVGYSTLLYKCFASETEDVDRIGPHYSY